MEEGTVQKVIYCKCVNNQNFAKNLINNVSQFHN